MMQRALTRAILATLLMTSGAAGLALAVDRGGSAAPAAASGAPAAAAPVASGANPVAPAAQAAATPSAPVVPAAAPTSAAPPSDAGAEARRKEQGGRFEAMGRREPKTERREAPEGVPSRADMDRYVEQRRREVDAQLRATDPWGQARRDWMEGRRQFRRDSLEMFRGAPGMPGAYPWGPLAPYYGMPGSEPVAPVPPTRQGMDAFFEKKQRAMEEQFHQATPWTPYGAAVQPGREPSQDWMLRQNPWAPVP